MTRPTISLLIVALTGVAALVGGSEPAWAHEGEGTVTIESVEASDQGANVRIRLTWVNDGHPAADATVTATPVSPSGTPQTPVPLVPIDDDGRYQADVSLEEPGTWTIRVTSVSPIATAETTFDNAPASSTPSTSETTSNDAGTATSGPTDTAGVTSPTDAVEPDDEDAGGTGSLVFVVVLGVVASGAVVLIWRTSRKLGRA